MQLVAYGAQDVYLTGNPQITFFKVVYRRHTNFSFEDIPQNFLHEPDFGKRSTCIISPEGDMIDRMSLKITLPAIPKINSSNNLSGIAKNLNNEKDTDTAINNDNSSIKFAWIKRIGFAMIKNVEIEINGKVVDRHFGEWMYIWSVLTTRNINDNGLNKLIGNVPE